MYDHHRQVIARLKDLFETQSAYLALIVGGSLVRGWGRADSDVDIILVVTDEDYARRSASGDLHYYDDKICDYEGGYVDGKIVDLAYLREVADHGNEPTRSAFVNAIVAFSRIDDLEQILARITVYPEAQREARMKAFYSQILLLNWFVGEAEKRNDRYLMTRTVADLVLFGGRMILAYNRLLYPYHKWLMRLVSEAPQKPENFIALSNALLESPGKQSANDFIDCLKNFRDWDVSFEQAIVNFMQDREWHWRRGEAPIHDW